MARRRRASNVNGYDLGVVYVPSHRHHKLALKPEMAQSRKYFMIHNFKPTIVRTVGNIVRSDCMTTPNLRCSSPCPTLPEALRVGMQEHWSSVLRRTPFSHFISSQYQKHGQHHKFRDPTEYHEQGYRHGRKYMGGGKYDLMRLMRRRGYRPGYRYFCREFVEALNQELGHPVLVTFKSSEGMKYLDEISSLYDQNSKRNRAGRDQTYDEESFFHLEDFSRILRSRRVRRPDAR